MPVIGKMLALLYRLKIYVARAHFEFILGSNMVRINKSHHRRYIRR